jgi:hypothetical protein
MREGELIAQRFSLERLAGRGGMGEVYRARDTQVGETVALKLLRGDAGNETQRFLREARVLEKLDHPAIVRHVAHGVTDSGELYLAMTWLEGEDLASRLDRGPLSISETLAVAERACAALQVAHAAGVVHRDLKPQNLFLRDSKPQDATLLDFGIARVQMTMAKTRTGAMLGTPAYMSPEQARGEKALDERCDIWALGAVLYECLTGEPPFLGDHVMAILAKVLFEPAPSLSDALPAAPAALSQLIGRMLTRAVDSRPRNMAEVLAALRTLETAGAPLATEKPLRLGGGEQRRLFVVLAAPARRSHHGVEQTASPGFGSTAESIPRLQLPWGVRERLAKDHRAQIEALIDGSVVAAISSEGSATDAAARAARCALELKDALPEASLALATGRGVVDGALPVGDVIDRAARLLSTHHPLSAAPDTALLLVDEGTAALLEGRFELLHEHGVYLLQGEAHAPETVRTLLGQPTPCIGRDRELATLSGVLAECINEPGARAVLVTAPPGTGKSRLRYEFMKAVARDGQTRVWLARGDPMSAGSAFGMLRQLIHQAAGIQSGDSVATARAHIEKRAAATVPKEHQARVAAFLGELAGAPFESGPIELKTARANAALMADQTRRAFEEWLAGECRLTPVVLVLEDLHWGDRATVAHLDSALEALRDLPLMVLALARPEVTTLFGAVWATRGLLAMPLGELSKKASERLARQVLAEHATSDIVERHHRARAGQRLLPGGAHSRRGRGPRSDAARLGARHGAEPLRSARAQGARRAPRGLGVRRSLLEAARARARFGRRGLPDGHGGARARRAARAQPLHGSRRAVLPPRAAPRGRVPGVDRGRSPPRPPCRRGVARARRRERRRAARRALAQGRRTREGGRAVSPRRRAGARGGRLRRGHRAREARVGVRAERGSRGRRRPHRGRGAAVGREPARVHGSRRGAAAPARARLGAVAGPARGSLGDVVAAQGV